MTSPKPPSNVDQRALPVARTAFDAAEADLVILFGSRARGDYTDGVSDIDLLVVSPKLPSPTRRQLAQHAAETTAARNYPETIPVQIIWQTSSEFHYRRRSVNHVYARAVREGFIFPRSPEHYPNHPDDYSYDEKIVALRTENADTHHEVFENYHFLLEHGLTDLSRLDRIAGKNAQEALEHALKALIAANGELYPTTHNLNDLLAAAQRADPEFAAAFTPSIDYNVLNQYAGSADYDIPELPITEIEYYRECVNHDYARVRNRIRQLTDARR